MKPKPWSHSALEDFKNCPRAFSEKRIFKSVVETKGEATVWGEQVHKHFEDRLVDGLALPTILEMHEGFLSRFEALPGEMGVEAKIALNLRGQPCGFFDEDVWYRGVIDALKVNGTQALVIDHKTGKVHQKMQQLALFAIWVFAKYPAVETVRAEYYWTQNRSKSGATYHRHQIPALWAPILPDLRQYAQAFREDTWQPRQSGLCNGWCPVETCEFWKPKRRRG
jgi:hypothetical protein